MVRSAGASKNVGNPVAVHIAGKCNGRAELVRGPERRVEPKLGDVRAGEEPGPAHGARRGQVNIVESTDVVGRRVDAVKGRTDEQVGNTVGVGVADCRD